MSNPVPSLSRELVRNLALARSPLDLSFGRDEDFSR